MITGWVGFAWTVIGSELGNGKELQGLDGKGLHVSNRIVCLLTMDFQQLADYGLLQEDLRLSPKESTYTLSYLRNSHIHTYRA